MVAKRYCLPCLADLMFLVLPLFLLLIILLRRSMMAAPSSRRPLWQEQNPRSVGFFPKFALWSAGLMAAAASPRRPLWQEQMMEEQEKERIQSALLAKIRDLRNSPAETAPLWQEFFRIEQEKETPDYSGMTEAERAAEAEKLRQEALQEARRLRREGDHVEALAKERLARIIDFDPKKDGLYFNRLYPTPDDDTFDLDDESPLGPRRFVKQVYENGQLPYLCASVNILSVKISCSDVGFPIHVYGSVLARDIVDCKCVYLFRRDRDHCQLITSKDDPLILTGPKRGLAVLDDIFLETDLKIKRPEGQQELSKGVESIRGIAGRSSLDKCAIGTETIATRLSTVEVRYAFVGHAVEATLAFRVVKGRFRGTITAHTASVQDRIQVYDSSKVTDSADRIARARDDRRGFIQLMRPVVSVYIWEKLIIDVAKASTGESEHLEFTPRVNFGNKAEIILGATKLRMMVAWSIMFA